MARNTAIASGLPIIPGSKDTVVISFLASPLTKTLPFNSLSQSPFLASSLTKTLPFTSLSPSLLHQIMRFLSLADLPNVDGVTGYV